MMMMAAVAVLVMVADVMDFGLAILEYYDQNYHVPVCVCVCDEKLRK